MNSTVSKVMLALALFLGLSNALLSTQSSGATTTKPQVSPQGNSSTIGLPIESPPPCAPNRLC